MWVSEDVEGLFVKPVGADDDEVVNPPPRPGRRWKAAVLIAITVIAIIAFLLWVPGAFASPSGGCGG